MKDAKENTAIEVATQIILKELKDTGDLSADTVRSTLKILCTSIFRGLWTPFSSGSSGKFLTDFEEWNKATVGVFKNIYPLHFLDNLDEVNIDEVTGTVEEAKEDGCMLENGKLFKFPGRDEVYRFVYYTRSNFGKVDEEGFAVIEDEIVYENINGQVFTTRDYHVRELIKL